MMKRDTKTSTAEKMRGRCGVAGIAALSVLVIALSMSAPDVAHAGSVRGQSDKATEIIRSLAPMDQDTHAMDPDSPAGRPGDLDDFSGTPPAPKTLSENPPAPHLQKTVTTLQVSIENRVYVINTARSIDLTVPFAFDSAALTEKAYPVLAALAAALQSDALRGRPYLIAGHTDARGSATYNLALSRRRADAVKTYLVTVHGIDPDRLITIGFGEHRLRFPDRPYAADNRRVAVSLIAEPTS